MTLGAMWLLAVLFGTLAAGTVRHGGPSRVVLVLLAGASTAWILGWTRYGSSELVRDEHAPMNGTEYWDAAVAPAAITSGIGMAAALVSLVLTGHRARMLCAGAAVALAIATVVQPGLSINSLPAAGLLAAAAARAAPPSRPADAAARRGAA